MEYHNKKWKDLRTVQWDTLILRDSRNWDEAIRGGQEGEVSHWRKKKKDMVFWKTSYKLFQG